MDPRIRISAASGVILGGLLLALLFRHPADHAAPPVAGTSDALVLRRPAPPEPAPVVTEAPARSPAPVQANPVESATVEAADVSPPPSLPKNYSGPGPAAGSPWGLALGNEWPEAAKKAPPTTHKIVDGDSLAALAERYLGTSARANEIFAANRGVLSAPQLLPIGAELKIPPQ